MAHRVSPEAERDLDEIWIYVARQSGSIELADRVVDSITDRFYLLSQHPHLGRRRDIDLLPGLRSFLAGNYVIVYRIENGDTVILHVVRGSRDVIELLPT